MPKHNLIVLEPGHRIGKLVFLRDLPAVGGLRRAIVKCDCGTEKDMLFYHFYYGKTKTCGCAQRDWWNAGTVKKHGMFGTPTYNTWRSMIVRCHSPKFSGYAHYGAKGISVCQEWRDSFEAFLEDMGVRPDGTTLDRRDVEGNYNKQNCRWSDTITQANNRRCTMTLEFAGERHTTSEWEDMLKLGRGMIRRRIKSGWPLAKAIGLPSLPQGLTGDASKRRLAAIGITRDSSYVAPRTRLKSSTPRS